MTAVTFVNTTDPTPPAYTRCPKCGTTPLPARQAFPAACPGCGVIFAKIGADRPARAATPQAMVLDETGAASWLALPEPVSRSGLAWRAALLLALAAWSWALVRMDLASGGVVGSFLHGPLLVFHEAGHVLCAVFGEWMAIAGGTVLQLAMPLVLAVALLWRRHDAFGAAVGMWFFGVSLLGVAPYVYDALQPQMMLLSGQTGEAGGHDWIYLLDTLGLRPRAQRLGRATHAMGTLVMLAALAWAGAVLLWQRRHADLVDG